ncbi:TPA: hypothetical protein JG872_000349 [Enterobacter hormaechei subsp. xiangfangensis]|nr:hypothetical protein [Enterobacter hormaechei subsp. xiangfangensis]HAV1860655.1 hypothetical protein [Enterobacter hormaechei subsp. xiangfangensis]
MTDLHLKYRAGTNKLIELGFDVTVTNLKTLLHMQDKGYQVTKQNLNHMLTLNAKKLAAAKMNELILKELK